MTTYAVDSTHHRADRSAPSPAARAVRRTADYVITSLITLLFAAPVIYMLVGSFAPTNEVLGGLSSFLPSQLTLDNYHGLLARFDNEATGYFWQFFGVSVGVTTVVVLGGLVVNSLAGYAIARLTWKGREPVLVVVVALVVLPFETVAVPLFYMLADLQNTVAVQALPFVANAFSIYLFYSFFRELPLEIEEAAMLDGAGPWRIYRSVIVPMSKPAFASAAILTFLTQWGSFLWPVLMVNDPAVRPLPLAISVLQGQPPYDWGQIMAFGVLMVLPVMVVFLAFQRWFVQSLASTAVKG